MRRRFRTLSALFAVVVTTLPATAGAAGRAGGDQLVMPGPLRYEVVAAKPRLNRMLRGPATRFVQGVPAEPVDSFVWSGEGSVEIDGELRLIVSPSSATGEIEARWRDEHGEWGFRQVRFTHPEHASGVRFGTSVNEISSIINQATQPNVYIHGDTTAGQPVLPTLFAYLATWGTADVELNGERFVNPYELPAPKWLAHVMVTEGVRHPDGSVRTWDNGIYNPSRAAEGIVEDADLEVHVVFHDEKFPRVEANIPPLFSFFYHLVYEDVSIRIVQSDEPLSHADEGADDVSPLSRPLGRGTHPAR